MKNLLVNLSVMWEMLKDDGGQDLIEYALMVALIASAATAGMNTLSGNINTAFTNIGTTLTTTLSPVSGSSGKGPQTGPGASNNPGKGNGPGRG